MNTLFEDSVKETITPVFFEKPKKSYFPMFLKVIKTFSFLWKITKEVFIIYLLYKTIFC